MRLLWVDDTWKEEPKIRLMRFAVVCFGVISSTATLDTVIRHHILKSRSTYPDIVRMIEDGMYIDDFSGGGDSVDKVFSYTER